MPEVFGKINKILSHSFVDGPGNRCVVFLQGCNFQCIYCHNPYTINVCSHCGVCVSHCPVGALKTSGELVLWDPDSCVGCDSCLKVCPEWSSPKVIAMSPLETWHAVQEFLPFICGVTVTGGEPTQQPEFLRQFFAHVHEFSDLTTCVETNGDFSSDYLSRLLTVLDFAMVDLKAYDLQLHQRITGKGNVRTLKNIQRLGEEEKLHMVRVTIVPGLSDTVTNVQSTASFLANIDPAIHLRLLRFRSHGVRGPAADWESPDEPLLDSLVEAAKACGLQHVDRSI
jgi:YjjW family glycine radical enzyme activase